jgi:hypothetical protein
MFRAAGGRERPAAFLLCNRPVVSGMMIGAKGDNYQ